jgi:hypothetical protein
LIFPKKGEQLWSNSNSGKSKALLPSLPDRR